LRDAKERELPQEKEEAADLLGVLGRALDRRRAGIQDDEIEEADDKGWE